MAADRLLLADGSSFLLLADGASRLLLSTTSSVPPEADPSPYLRAYALDARRAYGLEGRTTHALDGRRAYRRT